MTTETAEQLISLRPGGLGGYNPFAAFSQGAGVNKAAQQKVPFASLTATAGCPGLLGRRCPLHAWLDCLQCTSACSATVQLAAVCCCGGQLREASLARRTFKRRSAAQVVAPSSSTPHQHVVDERKKELGVDTLRYSAAFMLQFSEVRCLLSGAPSPMEGQHAALS